MSLAADSSAIVYDTCDNYSEDDKSSNKTAAAAAAGVTASTRTNRYDKYKLPYCFISLLLPLLRLPLCGGLILLRLRRRRRSFLFLFFLLRLLLFRQYVIDGERRVFYV